MKNFYFLFLLTLTCFVFSPQAKSQEEMTEQKGYSVFQKEDIVINAGIGLGKTFSYGGTIGLPLSASVEYGITDVIGVGGRIGYIPSKNLNVFLIGAKGSYHFNELLDLEVENLDLYAGVDLFYRNFSVLINSGLEVGFHLGGRYYFSETFGVHAEFGYGLAWLTGGVAFKL